VADHLAELVAGLERGPVIVGHSFGGLLAQILAGRGLAAATVAIDPAPFRGVLPLPPAALRTTFPVLSNPLNRGRAVTLTFAQFRYGWANAVSEEEARALHQRFHVAAPGKPIFQAAFANLNPATELRVGTRNPDRGPLLIFSGTPDHAVPPAMSRAAYRKQARNPGVTEHVELPDRGHSLTIDSGWREVCEASLRFLGRVAPASPSTLPQV
jgi:pimeloyl-ACP methyl ester carboxylesterase